MATSAQRRGLGRGLGALIPTQEQAINGSLDGDSSASTQGAESPEFPTVRDAGARYAELPIDEVSPNPRQPRMVFDEDALAELVDSITLIGLLQPVVVRRVDSGYELIAGERRLRACRLAGLERIPAIIRDTEDDALLRDALLENLHRANLNALEEAAAYQQLLEDFGCTQEELASRIGRSRPQVSNTLRLLRLPPDVQRRVAAGVLSAGHARALLSLESPEAIESLAQRIVSEGLRVRSVGEIILLSGPEGSRRKRKERKPRDTPASSSELVNDVISRLGDALDTRITITGLSMGRRGRIMIEVADEDDLRRVADIIDRSR